MIPITVFEACQVLWYDEVGGKTSQHHQCPGYKRDQYYCVITDMLAPSANHSWCFICRDVSQGGIAWGKIRLGRRRRI